VVTWLSVSAQDSAIRDAGAQFQLRANLGFMGVWQGTLIPIAQSYTVRIEYFLRRFFPNHTFINPYISVTVIDPPLGAIATRDGVRLPHTYWNERDPDHPQLCLYDPRETEWDPSWSIIDSIIPWISEWLYCFEFWQIDGQWRAPERHPERTPEPCQTNPNPEHHRALPEPYLSAAFHRLGQRIGAFASLPLMAAASAESSPHPSWPDWSIAIPAGVRLGPISTLLPARPPEASLRSDWVPDTAPANSQTSTSSEAEKSSHLAATVCLAA